MKFRFIQRKVIDSVKYRKSLVNQVLRTSRTRSKQVVTIFGSCRQDSVYDNFSITSIRDSLTYPHYSKEVIQAITYCMTGGGTSPSNLSVFRNKLLDVRLASSAKLKLEFDRTDIFIVEIASLLEYVKDEDYYHHIAVESVEGIEIRRQSYEELSADILKIVSLLAPKPVIFSTHYSTSRIGLRFELISFIEGFCRKHGLETINPTEMNRVWEPSGLHEHEEVISHFSKKGHQVMSDRYREKVLQISMKMSEKPLVQKYKPGLVLNDYHGLGDFILGSLRLHQEAISWNRAAYIDISDHPLGNFFNSKYAAEDSHVTPIVFESASKLFKNSSTVFTHLRPLRKITTPDLDFVLRNSFEPNDEFKDQIFAYKEMMGVNEQGYSVIHLRLGDEYMGALNSANDGDDIRLKNRITNYVRTINQTKKVLVASDSIELLNHLEENGCDILKGKVAHLGKENQDLSAIRDTLIQFMILKESKEIIQASNYGWGSGFSETASVLGQVPLTKVNILSIR